MVPKGRLTIKQQLLYSPGFYGHWWDFSPYNTKEYQNRFKDFKKYKFYFN